MKVKAETAMITGFSHANNADGGKRGQ